MLTKHILYKNKIPYFFEESQRGFYVTYSDFLNTPKHTWDIFLKKYPKVIISISYDFSLQYLLKQELNTHYGLFIQPVIPIEKNVHPIKIPIIETITPMMNQYSFYNMIESIKEYMKCGNFYLMNYTFPFDVMYSKMSSMSPNNLLGDFGSFLQLPNKKLLSFSPENFISIEHGTITTSPIKGTAPTNTDINLLLTNEKEQAEQSMIVDLLRNDLGKISHYGSVRLDAFKHIKKHHNLYQMYSTISGRIPTIDLYSLLDLLPAGSISGVPKVEVCKFLHQNEIQNRGFYTGIAGYFDFDKQEGFFNILIRMLEYENNKIILKAGAGITVDSNPNNEYLEIIQKAKSVQDYISTLHI